MEKTCKILRSSIHIFFQNYHYFAAVTAIFALPYSLSVLLSQALIPSLPSSRHFLQELYYRLNTLFQSASFPPSSALLSLKLSQAVSTSVLTLPFTLTFLLPAKATIIQLLNEQKTESPTALSSTMSLYFPLFSTFMSNSIFMLAVNVSSFAFSFTAFGFLEFLGYSSSTGCILGLATVSVIVYSIVLANSLVVCNLALVVSGMERINGFRAILKAFVLSHRRIFTAMLLALPINFGAAGISAMFENRITKHYYTGDRFMAPFMALEVTFIAYLYALLVVLDTVMSYVFLRSCKESFEWSDQETSYGYYITIEAGEE